MAKSLNQSLDIQRYETLDSAEVLSPLPYLPLPMPNKDMHLFVIITILVGTKGMNEPDSARHPADYLYVPRFMAGSTPG